MVMILLDRETRLEIKAEIVRRGLYQYKVAEAIGIPENAFSAILNGRRLLPAAKADELKAFLGMELAGVSA
jgi:plasmid maintenance system antidote protein VapI